MKRWFTNPAKLRQYFLLGGDAVLVLLSFGAGLLVRSAVFNVEPTALDRLGIFLLFVFLTGVFQIFTFFVADLYNLNLPFGVGKFLLRVMTATASAVILSASAYFFVPRFVVGRTVLLVYPAVMTVGAFFWRWFFFETLLAVTRKHNLAVVGLDRSIKVFLSDLDWFPVKDYDLRILLVENQPETQLETLPVPVIVCPPERLGAAAAEEQVDILIFSISEKISSEYKKALLDLQLRGYHVYNLPDFYGELIGKVPVHSIDDRWVLDSIFNDQRSETAYRIQRALEITFAFLLFLLTAPLFGLISLVVMLDSKGPVFFRQKRLGYRRKEFELLKFRTMEENAEANSGPTWTFNGDPRVTRVGKFLRKTGLDELPQLINILKGEMTYVGFRPIRKHFADMLAEEIPYYDLRFTIRPGVTGWPQIQHNYAGSVEGQLEKFEYELFYLQNASFLLDGFILLKTIQKILGRGFSQT